MAGASGSGLSDWLGIAAGVLAVVSGLLALPPLLARRRRAARRRQKAGQTLKALLPSRAKLVNRSNEVAQVLAHLDRGEYLVAIEGGIGVGKSALAMEVAYQLAASRLGGAGTRRGVRHYESLVWIDARNGPLGLEDVARTLSLVGRDPTLSAAPAEAKADALRAYLAAHPAVLVVDNLRLSATETRHLVDFLRTLPAGSLAIVSANTPGQLAAPRVLLRELQLGHMRELLIQEAIRRDVPAIVSADDATFERIHRVLGGNPRAIELFVLACSREVSSLDQRLRQLETGSDDLTVTLFETVWAEVDDAGRDVLAVCAFLGGSVSQSQIAAALGLSDAGVQAAVERLWSDGLISSHQRFDRVFYSCSAALRVFVVKQTPPQLLGQIADRLAAYFIARFRVDWEDAEGAAEHIDAIRLLIGYLYDRGRYDSCVELFAVTLDIFFTLGLFDDRIALGRIAYDAATAAGLAEERSLALSVVSSTHAVRGEDQQAAEAVQLGLRIAREADSPKEIARQLRCEGFRLFRAGNASEALTVVCDNHAEDLARESGDMNNAIDILSLVGAAYWHLGDLGSCETTVRRFLAECERLPWERGKAYAIRDLAEVTLMKRSFRDAQLLLGQARQITVQYRDVRQLVRVDLSEARLRLFQGHLRPALRFARAAAGSARRLSLAGEMAEAEAVARYARRAIRQPWLWLWLRVRKRPRTRFTEQTVGGD